MAYNLHEIKQNLRDQLFDQIDKRPTKLPQV